LSIYTFNLLITGRYNNVLFLVEILECVSLNDLHSSVPVLNLKVHCIPFLVLLGGSSGGGLSVSGIGGDLDPASDTTTNVANTDDERLLIFLVSEDAGVYLTAT
jgi:hypothetical protein